MYRQNCIIIFLYFIIISLSNAESGGATNYFSIEPPLVVNVNGGKRINHLQVNTQVKLTDSSVAKNIERLMPIIRHEMIILLSNKTSKELRTLKGKELLRVEVLQAIQKVLQDNTGDKGIEELYFTGFIIQ